MDVVLSEPWGDATSEHLVTKIKPLSFSILSKITRSRDPHSRGQGGFPFNCSCYGCDKALLGYPRKLLQLGELQGTQGDESIRVNFSGCFLDSQGQC